MVSPLDTASRWWWPLPDAKRRRRNVTHPSRVPRCRLDPTSRLVPRGLATAWADAAEGPPIGGRAAHLAPPERTEGVDRRAAGAGRTQASAARRLLIRARLLAQAS
jgi:hypothetical protein